MDEQRENERFEQLIAKYQEERNQGLMGLMSDAYVQWKLDRKITYIYAPVPDELSFDARDRAFLKALKIDPS